jgi:alginate O-acetyltransferase complex protein AlgJ
MASRTTSARSTNPGRDADATPGRIAADRLQGAAMIGVLAFGLWQGIAAMTTPSAQRQFDGKLSLSALLAGRTAEAVNTIMAHDLPTDLLWRTMGGIIRWSIFASGGPPVWVGTQNWLYLTDELRPWPDADASMRTRARIVRAVADKLQARGIPLVVGLVPDKARIESATLGAAPRAAQTIRRYGDFAADLRAAGVEVVDLSTVLSEAQRTGDVFYRTDTHWNQRGAALAAAALAAAAPKLPQQTAFRTDADTEMSDGPGDLLRLMSLDRLGDVWAPRLRPLPDRQHLEHTAPLAPPDADDGGLLDDGPDIPVALVGSSFSLNANFAGRLQEYLHAALGNFGRLGGGFAGGARAYFTGATFKETPPKLVIWEIPERAVGQKLDDDDKALAAWANEAATRQ